MQGNAFDAPWKNVGTIVKKALADSSLKAIMKTPEQVSKMMQVVASGDTNAFMARMTQEKNALSIPKTPVIQKIEKMPGAPVPPPNV